MHLQTAGVLADLFLVFSSENLPDHCQHLAYVPLDEEVDSFWNAMELSIGKQVNDLCFALILNPDNVLISMHPFCSRYTTIPCSQKKWTFL